MHKAFKKQRDDSFYIYRLPQNKWTEVKDFLSSKAISCFLNANQLQRLNEKGIDDRKQELRDIYFPDRGNIKSGDFGEIFSYYFLRSEFQENDVELNGPKKWIWKDSKNKAAPGADVLLYSKNPNARNKDLLLSVESKMAASKPAHNINRIQNAIDGASEDRVSRMAKTIDWLKQKYHKEGQLSKKEEIDRFSNPTDDPYEKQYFAIAIFDSSFCDSEACKECELTEGIDVYIVSIDDLKKMYEAFFEDAINAC